MDENEHGALESLLYGKQFKRMMEKELEPIQKEFDLCSIDVQILLYLDKHQEKNDTSKDILKLNMYTKGHISQSLSRLQKKGYVYMQQDQEDRRCTHNHLTSEAYGIIGKIKSINVKLWDVLMKDVTDEELEALRSVAKKITHNIEGVLKD